MAYFARIESGLVVEILQANALPDFHPSLIWVTANEAVKEGWLWDGNSFSDPADSVIVTVQELREESIEDLKTYRNQKYLDGFLYGSNYFQIDSEAQTNMIAIMVQFTLGNANPHGGQWFDVDNTPVTMNDSEVQVFIQAAFAYIVAVKNRYWFHDAAIKLLNAKQDIIDYDFTTGWP